MTIGTNTKQLSNLILHKIKTVLKIQFQTTFIEPLGDGTWLRDSPPLCGYKSRHSVYPQLVHLVSY